MGAYEDPGGAVILVADLSDFTGAALPADVDRAALFCLRI